MRETQTTKANAITVKNLKLPYLNLYIVVYNFIAIVLLSLFFFYSKLCVLRVAISISISIQCDVIFYYPWIEIEAITIILALLVYRLCTIELFAQQNRLENRRFNNMLSLLA